MRESGKEKKIYLELLRGIAVLLVIFNHTDGFFLYYSTTENGLTWIWSLFCSVLCRINVPLFFMISGALLLGKEESLRDLFRKRIARILAVLLIFSLFQYGIDLWRGAAVPVSLSWFVKAVLAGQVEETYWFLYAYLGMLLLLPFLRCLVRQLPVSGYRYLLALEVALGVVAPVIGAVTGFGLQSTVFQLNVYVFYLLMGYDLDQRAKTAAGAEKKETAVAALTALGCICLTVGIVVWRRLAHGSYQQGDLDWFTPVLAVAVFDLVRCLCRVVKARPARVHTHTGMRRLLRRSVETVGSCAFGIYLVEQPVRILLLRLYFYFCDHTVGVIACTVYVLSTFLVSLCAALLLRRIPLLKKIV